MKNLFKLMLVLCACCTIEINACTNMLVTKGATTDGSTIITYSADSYEFYGDLAYYPAAIYSEGTMLDIYEWDTGKFLGKIPQAKETYLVVGNMNEYQVSIGETTFGGRAELENDKGIMDYGSLIYVALQRAKTAREAIKIMGELVAAHGYSSSGESFSIADPNEVWIMEMIGKGEKEKGAVWVAIKIPDGYISAHANQARITSFPLNDPGNCLYSPDVISFARAKGYFEGKDKEFSFSDVYAPLDFGAVRFCEGRVWSLFRRTNKEMEKYISYIKCESQERMPLYIKPDRKLSVKDVMELMRDHFEGTELDMSKGLAAGPYSSPYRWRPLTWKYQGEEYFNERPISTQQTGFSFVAQSRAWLPNPIGGVLWFGVDDTYNTVYVPLYCGIMQAPHCFQKGVGSFTQFSWESAFWVFNFVSNFAYPRYSLMINDIKNEQRSLEGQFLSQQEGIEKNAAELFQGSAIKAKEYLTEYSCRMSAFTLERWKKLGEKLMVKYMDGNVKNEFGKPTSPGYPEEWKKLMIAEQGEAIKLKKLPGEIKMAYAENVDAGNENLKNKKYAEAMENFEKALKLRPSEEYPKKKLEQLKKLLAEIDLLTEQLMQE